jgi:phosphoglucomutase/phosphomannomutase
VTAIRALPWAEAVRTGRVHFLDEEPHRAYIELCRKQTLVSPPKSGEIRVVFTPLHGVGAMTAMEVLTSQGFRVLPVPEQMTPDGQFPHVTQTPNPEVPASMDRAARVAREHDAYLILATDPDADRLGAMAPARGATGASEYRYVTGNEIAALLTHFKLHKLAQQGRLPASPIVIKTEVTTTQVTRIARHFRAQVVEDLLVGFKYVADVLWQLEQHGAYGDVRGTPEDFVIGCEESHGILVTPHLRDKDAAGAALLLAELALDQKRRGRTVLDYLDELSRQFGYFRTEGLPIVMTGLAGKQDMARMLDALRARPPAEVAGLQMTAFEDLRDERGRMGPVKGATDSAARNFLIFRLGDRARAVLRPSGTEPKAKIYLEASSAPCAPGTPNEAWARTCREVDELVALLGEDFRRQALALIGRVPEALG